MSAVGDENFQKKCLERLKSIRAAGVTIILVTHDMTSVLNMADRVLVLDHGEPQIEDTPSAAVAFYHDLMDRRRRQSESGQVVPTAKAETEPVKITSARLSGLDNSDVKADNPVLLDIDINILGPLPDELCVGFAIHTLDGKRIMGTNTNVSKNLAKLQSQDSWPQKGSFKVSFQFENMPLAAGKYRLIVAAHDGAILRPYYLYATPDEIRVAGKNDLDNRDRDIVETQSLIDSVQISPL